MEVMYLLDNSSEKSINFGRKYDKLPKIAISYLLDKLGDSMYSASIAPLATPYSVVFLIRGPVYI